MEDTAKDALLKQVKRKCKVTWNDEETNEFLADIMGRADAVIRDKVGIDDEFDFSQPGRENMLFVAWCYYAFHDAEDLFEANYAPEIMQCRRHWEVKDYADTQKN